MAVTLDWFGCTTYRLNIDGLVVFLDTFMDRISSAPDNGATSADIKEADFAIIGHSHMDHIEGADIIARNTGAKVHRLVRNRSCAHGSGCPEGSVAAIRWRRTASVKR